MSIWERPPRASEYQHLRGNGRGWLPIGVAPCLDDSPGNGRERHREKRADDPAEDRAGREGQQYDLRKELECVAEHDGTRKSPSS